MKLIDKDALIAEIEEAALKLCPLPPLYNEKQRKSKDYADSWTRARDEQTGFRLGANWMKRQLIESAINGEVLGEIRSQESEPYQIYVESDYLPLDGNIKYGDKVKLIIIKED